MMSDALIQETLLNDQITRFTLTESDPTAIDAWVAAVAELTALHTLATDPIFVLHDFRQGRVQFTPYFRNRSQELAHQFPEFHGYVALVLRKTTVIYMARLFLERIIRKAQPHAEYRIFFEYEQAITWLHNKQTQTRTRQHRQNGVHS